MWEVVSDGFVVDDDVVFVSFDEDMCDSVFVVVCVVVLVIDYVGFF